PREAGARAAPRLPSGPGPLEFPSTCLKGGRRMRFRFCAGLSALCVLGVGVGPVHSGAPEAPPQARKAAERGLTFLQQDGARWRKERKCATCHHGTMTVWALCEARSRGYAVTPESLADTVRWTKERLKDIDKPRDKRPGWSMVSTPALYLSVMARCLPGQDA